MLNEPYGDFSDDRILCILGLQQKIGEVIIKSIEWYSSECALNYTAYHVFFPEENKDLIWGRNVEGKTSQIFF